MALPMCAGTHVQSSGQESSPHLGGHGIAPLRNIELSTLATLANLANYRAIVT
ncbi:MAG: hypothetical protein AB7F96_13725 [Beijerinckiaceae bacterium]